MKKIYGTTIYIGSHKINTVYGKFNVFVFQDMIDIKYIFALTYGSLKSDAFYIRAHSSCLTSETFHSMDCDCIHQLNGAMKLIAEKGSGILFYLLQSGRGASYISKSRGCQMVQHLQDTITTFEAYERLGLKHDYRNYRNIRDICYILGILDKKFYLITNNPDKIKKINSLGLNIIDTILINIEPNMFNKKYLMAKKNTGHKLLITDTNIKLEHQPSIKPFEPYHLKDLNRFIHCASYFLPIEPVSNLILSDYKPENGYYEITNDNKYLIRSDIKKPYWFKVDVYYDIVKHGETMVLSYGSDSIIPIVRIHSEFILNRFPLKDTTYKNKFKTAIIEIVKNGAGLIIVANHNGHDYSIGNFILDKDHVGFEQTGITRKRNLLPVILLLKYHLKSKPIKIFYSEESKQQLEIALGKGDINILEWISIDPNDTKGHYLLQSRLKSIRQCLFSIEKPKLTFELNKRYLLTGIGSSEAHVKYLNYLGNLNKYNFTYIPINGINQEIANQYEYLIIFSQGLSPHGIRPINFFKKNQIILFTSVTNDNKNKTKVDIINNVNCIVNYPMEDEYEILVRVIGPICGFRTIDALFDLKLKTLPKFNFNKYFLLNIKKYQSVTIIINYPLTEYYHNLKYKLIEGPMIKTVNVIDELSFAHGYYQNTELWPSCFICINIKNKKIINVLENKSFIIVNTDDIIQLEYIFNNLMIKLIRQNNINQKTWPGKDKQYLIYT